MAERSSFTVVVFVVAILIIIAWIKIRIWPYDQLSILGLLLVRATVFAILISLFFPFISFLSSLAFFVLSLCGWPSIFRMFLRVRYSWMIEIIELMRDVPRGTPNGQHSRRREADCEGAFTSARSHGGPSTGGKANNRRRKSDGSGEGHTAADINKIDRIAKCVLVEIQTSIKTKSVTTVPPPCFRVIPLRQVAPPEVFGSKSSSSRRPRG